MAGEKDLPPYLALVHSSEGSSEGWHDIETGRPRRSGGGGDGMGGGFEIRVAKLESDVEHLKRDVGELRTDMRDVRDRLTRIETRVDHLPGKGFIVSSVLVTLAVVAGLIAFQNQVQTFVGQRPAAVGAQL